MRVGMERYKAEFPDADVVLFEPARDDEVIFFANIFSYADRKRLAEHAYRHTLGELDAPRRRTRADLRPSRDRASTARRSKGRLLGSGDARRRLARRAGCGIACGRSRRRWARSRKR